MTRYAMLFVLIFNAIVCCAPLPPVAKIEPKKVDLGGQEVIDNYWWLRDRSDAAVTTYIESENAYTDEVMQPTRALQEKLFKELTDRLPPTNESVPYKEGDWWYSTLHGEEYPVELRRKGSPDAKPERILDVNKLAEGKKFFDFNAGVVSDDGNLLAFSTDSTGNRQYVLQIKDLRTGKIYPDKIQLIDSFDWASDNQTIYYASQDQTKRDYRIYRHHLGDESTKDEMLFEEKDEQFSVEVSRTRDRKFVIIAAQSNTSSECYAVASDQPSAKLRLIEPRKIDRLYYIDHRGSRFYIRTNDTSRNFRIVTTPDDHPESKNWSELIESRNDIVIDDHDVFAHHIVLAERSKGLTQLAISKLPDGQEDPALPGKLTPKELKFDEPDYTVAVGDNHEFDSATLRFTYTSLTTPMRVYDLNLATGEQVLKKQDPIEGGFKSSDYREERLFAPAADGTLIPISLVYRIPKPTGDGPATRPSTPMPILLEGYGAYGMSNDVNFSPARLSLLDRGMGFAIAHVRGGGEYGRTWYDAGRMMTKQNTFNDFITVAEFLQKNGYTSADKLAITGASAGGLLIGAVVNQRPDLFKAAYAQVPWVDVLSDMCDPTIPLTTLEYAEWGNPAIPAQRTAIAAYDPYSNVKPQAYPAMLVRESINDSQVQYWDAVRWVARLRAAKVTAGKAGESELLLKMNMDAGHNGASGLDAGLRDEAFDSAWILTRLGVEK